MHAPIALHAQRERDYSETAQERSSMTNDSPLFNNSGDLETLTKGSLGGEWGTRATRARGRSCGMPGSATNETRNSNRRATGLEASPGAQGQQPEDKGRHSDNDRHISRAEFQRMKEQVEGLQVQLSSAKTMLQVSFVVDAAAVVAAVGTAVRRPCASAALW